MLLLCVDDDPDDAGFFLDAIKIIDPAYTCVMATNGKEALSILSSLNPDFIFLDINMPVLNGIETLRLIKQDKRLRKIPLCILSTSIDEYNTEKFKKMGATFLLVKPNSFDDLCAGLKQMIRQPVNKM